MEENEIIIPIARNLRNERCDGLWSLLMPGQEENRYTTYLNVKDLVIDTSKINNTDSMEGCPSMQELLRDWRHLEER